MAHQQDFTKAEKKTLRFLSVVDFPRQIAYTHKV